MNKNKSKIEQKWYDTPLEEREAIFRYADYTFPEVLAKRMWRKLSKEAKATFKNNFKTQPQ